MKDIKWIGWNHGTDAKGKQHDKIWGAIKVDGEIVTFWGKRTAKLTFKRERDYSSGDDWYDSSRKKERGGYVETTFERIALLDPEFEDRFDSDLMLTMLGNSYHQNPNAVAE
jgi:hypothetical protein